MGAVKAGFTFHPNSTKLKVEFIRTRTDIVWPPPNTLPEMTISIFLFFSFFSSSECEREESGLYVKELLMFMQEYHWGEQECACARACVCVCVCDQGCCD